jgi:secreted Zn-dependent insulinase-like peptidase
MENYQKLPSSILSDLRMSEISDKHFFLSISEILFVISDFIFSNAASMYLRSLSMCTHLDKIEKQTVEEMVLAEQNLQVELKKVLVAIETKRTDFDNIRQDVNKVKKYATDLQTYVLAIQFLSQDWYYNAFL